MEYITAEGSVLSCCEDTPADQFIDEILRGDILLGHLWVGVRVLHSLGSLGQAGIVLGSFPKSVIVFYDAPQHTTARHIERNGPFHFHGRSAVDCRHG